MGKMLQAGPSAEMFDGITSTVKRKCTGLSGPVKRKMERIEHVADNGRS